MCEFFVKVRPGCQKHRILQCLGRPGCAKKAKIFIIAGAPIPEQKRLSFQVCVCFVHVLIAKTTIGKSMCVFVCNPCVRLCAIRVCVFVCNPCVCLCAICVCVCVQSVCVFGPGCEKYRILRCLGCPGCAKMAKSEMLREPPLPKNGIFATGMCVFSSMF